MHEKGTLWVTGAFPSVKGTQVRCSFAKNSFISAQKVIVWTKARCAIKPIQAPLDLTNSVQLGFLWWEVFKF